MSGGKIPSLNFSKKFFFNDSWNQTAFSVNRNSAAFQVFGKKDSAVNIDKNG